MTTRLSGVFMMTIKDKLRTVVASAVKQLMACLLLIGLFLPAYGSQQMADEHKRWLKEKFADQHQQLIPIVAVADIFYGCDQARHQGRVGMPIKSLIIGMDKNELAEKLITCLAGQSIQSDQAINFGLIGCFTEQFAYLPKAEQQEKLAQVTAALTTLSYQERQKSFTQCTTLQAIDYLK